MGSQVAGTAFTAVVVLGYVLLVQSMTAAVLVLAEFIVWRVRALWSVLGDASLNLTHVSESPEVRPEGTGRTYRLGGDIRW
jgi:hypothetical protein